MTSGTKLYTILKDFVGSVFAWKNFELLHFFRNKLFSVILLKYNPKLSKCFSHAYGNFGRHLTYILEPTLTICMHAFSCGCMPYKGSVSKSDNFKVLILFEKKILSKDKPLKYHNALQNIFQIVCFIIPNNNFGWKQ